jgi:hypothetical protein
MKQIFPQVLKNSLVGICFAATSAAWAGDCRPDMPAKMKASTLAAKPFNVSDAISCGNLGSIFKRLASNPKFGGRELEKNKPLDKAAAQAEVDKAMADPKLKAELEQIKATESDELRRLALEAALFDANQLYGARDLRIEEISGKL